MAKKPVTNQTASQATRDGNPVKNRRFYLKQMFQDNEAAYNDFVKYWKEAIDEGVEFVYKIAWIKLRQYWDQDESGYWVQRLVPEIDNE